MKIARDDLIAGPKFDPGNKSQLSVKPLLNRLIRFSGPEPDSYSIIQKFKSTAIRLLHRVQGACQRSLGVFCPLQISVYRFIVRLGKN